MECCHDCHVAEGQPHEDGCDVARCTVCGQQRITCAHGGSDEGWGEIWNGPSSAPHFATFAELVAFTERRLGAHPAGCLQCASAMRWSGRCETGKILYISMIAVQYACDPETTETIENARKQKREET